MNLEFEFSYDALLKPGVTVGAGPLGVRSYHEIIGGVVQGKRLNGQVLTGGGDWLLMGQDGWGQVDVRAQILTDDGVAIYSYYKGLLEFSAKVAEAAAKGGGTDFPDQYFRTTPRFEAGDPRYAWLNQNLFVAEGRIIPGGVAYNVYRVT
jgi:hypothetical protein